MSEPAPQPPTDAVVVHRVRCLTCVFAGVLGAATWSLWIPGPELPDVPWYDHWRYLPETRFDWVPLSGAILWLVLEFIGLDRYRWRTEIIRGVLGPLVAVLLVLDQHRLQPWVLQMLLLAAILLVADARTSIRCARILVISIYVHSALSKVDAAFLDSHGQFLLDGLTTALGLSTELWSEIARRVLAGMFPIGELLTSLLLLWPRSRPYGLMLAILMHVLLLLTLGPWGHGHHWGVLIWNVYFILLDLLIFRRTIPGEDAMTELPDRRFSIRSPGPCRSVGIPAAWAGTTLFAALPCLSWWGLWDHWPSWAVYSSRPAIVEVSIPERDIERLPESLQPFVSSPEPLSDKCRVNLDAWSFATLRSPMYPQERYRVAVALALCEQCHIDEMRLVIHSSPDRWTGERETVVLEGQAEIQVRADSFWLNAKSRRE